jgi:hypothetical protein
MSFLIVKPQHCEPSYAHAARVFADMYEKITGQCLPIAKADDGASDLFVIGSDSVNDFVTDEFLEGNIGALDVRYGTDDYCIWSYTKEERRIVLLAGGCGRSTIYAVYDFFERFADCHYFWDGDIIPKKDKIEIGDVKILQSPRFEYRGLRYFAHRGLKRFQAEHWSFEDWKQELDWMMKKRLNFFMLRIGMDDVWQRAFPDIVKYPSEYNIITDEKSYDNRSDFWTTKYRGELRERVMAYARELELIYPTDCGTMTHWYSRTPKEFLQKKKPTFIGQEITQYTEFDSGKVWNFLENENMDNYMKLTETMVDEYDKQTAYFHTIGLGERMVYKDRAKNHRFKLVAYRRILQALRRRYPNSVTFIASWDFVGWWQKDEVKELIKEFDPNRTVILDYTSEINDPEQSFLNWNIVNRFPWIFGLFHAYEAESELRGPYERTAERLEIAASDPYCKGMILWPELSHSDPIVLEYLAKNAWSPLEYTVEQTVAEFCHGRYGEHHEFMNRCWQEFLPFMMLADWGGYSKRGADDPLDTEYYNKWASHSDIWTKPTSLFKVRGDMRYLRQIRAKIKAAKEKLASVIDVITAFASLGELWECTFIKRDAIDIVRTTVGRFLNFLLVAALHENDVNVVKKQKELYMELVGALSVLLNANDDFSVYKTLEALKATAPTNPDFERTLKENISNYYCRQAAQELMEPIRRESERIFDWILDGKKAEQIDAVNAAVLKAEAEFFDTPMLPPVAPSVEDVSLACEKIANGLKEIYSVLR